MVGHRFVVSESSYDMRNNIYPLVFILFIGLNSLLVSAEEALSTTEFLQHIESRFADVNEVRADFVQKKTLAVFDHVLKLTGWIAFDRQGHFAWHVQSPMKYSLVVKDGSIIEWDEDSGKVRKTLLSANPVLEVVFDQLTKWVSGQYASFEDRYAVDIVSEQPPIIQFVPCDGAIEKKMIRHVVIRFSKDDAYVQEIQVDEISGDKTVLTFSNVHINEPLSPDTWDVNASTPGES